MIEIMTGKALKTRDIQLTKIFIGELKTQNIMDYVFDIDCIISTESETTIKF
jgi:prephenate dehydratase